jgi:hypothetical protein
MTTNYFLCVVPVSKVLPLSFTRFYAYTRNIDESDWQWEKIVWMLGRM